jgi:hypothetical protein
MPSFSHNSPGPEANLDELQRDALGADERSAIGPIQPQLVIAAWLQLDIDCEDGPAFVEARITRLRVQILAGLRNGRGTIRSSTPKSYRDPWQAPASSTPI